MPVLVRKPPAPLALDADTRSVFLAGSIEMGLAEDWQSTVTEALTDLAVDPAVDLAAPNLVVLNPRRDAWDASWEQSITNPLFTEQVTWELSAQEQATLILMYFAPTTRAPITLLELGLFAQSGKLIVCCPEGYWRRGNVEVVCARYGIPMVADLPALISTARERLRTAHVTGVVTTR